MSSDKSKAFVEFVLSGVDSENKGFRAAFSRADSPATEYRCWGLLAPWVDLEDVGARRAYALVAASISRARPRSNGTLGLGNALYHVAKERAGNDPYALPDSPRLRRLLSSTDREELASVLRSLLRLVESKDLILDYPRLLDEILWFSSGRSRDRTAARWAQEFYRRVDGEG